MTIQREIIRKSVTRDELEANNAGVFRFFIGNGAGGLTLPIEPTPPAYWSPARDLALKRAYRAGGQWASAVNIAVTRITSAGYEVGGDVALRVRRAREMIGASWIDLTTKIARDYVIADNGCFVEIVRATKGYGSRVIGLVPLSGARCVRTGNSDEPVVYIDTLGQYHALKSYQVAEFSDLSDEDFFGVGLCATSRAWDAIYEHMAVKQYFAEKATGRRPLAIYIVGGMSTELIEKGLNAAQDGASSRGIVSHMGATVIGNANPLQPTIATIPLAELPDGFDQQKHEELTQIRFANALGIDPSELNPRLIGNRQLGAGSQSQVLDDKQESKGLIALRQKLLAFLNDTDRWHLLPGGVTFAWNERDFNDQQIKAGTAQTRATTRAAQIASGEISADEARQLAVDAGDLPETFISIDRTDEETLTDEDKADAGDVAQLVDAPSSDTTLSDAQPLRADSRGIVQNVAQKSHEGAMIALYPDDAGKDALAQMRDAVEWPAGSIITPPDEYHVTMAYLGKAADISAEGRTSIVQQIEPLRTVRVIEARFNGVARFNGTPESGDAIVVLLSEPALIEMAGFARGIGDESEHPFNAHITLAYIPHDAATPTVPAMFETLNLDTLSAVFAGARVDFPFASETTKKALAAFKAARTTLVTISPQLTRRPSDRANVRGYYEQVTRELRAYMRVLVDKCKQYCPVDSGALRNSITYEVKSPVTAFARGVLYAGNAERPEKVVRSVLHGRRGFGPKDPNGTLAFETADGTVFTKHVSAARGNDWFARAWKDTEHERRVMARRIGKLTNDAVSMRDVPLTNAEHIDGYDERAGDTVPNTARWRKAGGLQ